MSAPFISRLWTILIMLLILSLIMAIGPAMVWDGAWSLVSAIAWGLSGWLH